MMYSTAKKTKTTTNNWCRVHSTKASREINRSTMCPSKLSKYELEDLYYRVLDSNIDLKKTVNEQKDKIKVLSTKVLRMTATQKNSISKDTWECCSAAKALINELNNHIAELQATIVRKNEKIHLQQTKLCSTKQFLSKSKVASQCTLQSAFINSPYSTKHHVSGSVSVTSARSEVKLRKTQSQSELTEPDKTCNDNKCSTSKEELRQKMELELTSWQASSAARLSELEAHVSTLQSENCRVRAQRSVLEDTLRENDTERRRLREQLTSLEAHSCDLQTQLVVEQKRVSELEMQLRSAALFTQVARTIELHLANRDKQAEPVNQEDDIQYRMSLEDLPATPSKLSSNPDCEVVELQTPWSSPQGLKCSDDSGFTDVDVDTKEANKTNSDLLKRITELQTENEQLKLNAVKHYKNSSKPSCTDSNDLVHDSNLVEQRSVVDIKDDSVEESYTANSVAEVNIEFINNTQADSRVNFNIRKENKMKSPERTLEEQSEIVNKTEKSDNNNVNTKTITKRELKGTKRSKRKKSKQRSNKNQISATKDENINECAEVEENIQEMEDLPISDQQHSALEANPEALTEPQIEQNVPSHHNTYTIYTDKSMDHDRLVSPDDTEYEISSIANTPKNHQELSPQSPGERKCSLSCTTSSSATADNSCLSDGEVPHRKDRILSYGEKTLPEGAYKWNTMANKPLKVNMNDALQSVSKELARCRLLLRANTRGEVKCVSSVR